MRESEVRIDAGGAVLVGTLFEAEEPALAIVIHAATAVPSRIYASFARALVERGATVLTYDYRGTGRSARTPRSLDRGVRMRDWIDRDADAATDRLAELAPGLPLLAIGHSVGAHAIALGAGRGRLDGAVFVSMHLANTKLIPDPRERARVRLLLGAVAPVATRVVGYMPGRRFGLGEDLPAAAMLEWSGWTRKTEYFFDDPSMDARRRGAGYAIPTLYVGIDDDPWSTPHGMDRFAAHLPAAPIERLQLTPAPGSPAGHLGFFKPTQSDTLWPPVLEWVQRRAASARAERAARPSASTERDAR
ncbi:alpha/beta fold hydrolase [Agromyces seonyuensis]|uniref:alpha/beta fold hydrolase n=1 Tax=Agromyces seonyuensis TaxID=2662446 RepID=UPI0013665397